MPYENPVTNTRIAQKLCQLPPNKRFPSACDEPSRMREQGKKLRRKIDAPREELGNDEWLHSSPLCRLGTCARFPLHF
jgi:hypothetical protein